MIGHHHGQAKCFRRVHLQVLFSTGIQSLLVGGKRLFKSPKTAETRSKVNQDTRRSQQGSGSTITIKNFLSELQFSAERQVGRRELTFFLPVQFFFSTREFNLRMGGVSSIVEEIAGDSEKAASAFTFENCCMERSKSSDPKHSRQVKYPFVPERIPSDHEEDTPLTHLDSEVLQLLAICDDSDHSQLQQLLLESGCYSGYYKDPVFEEIDEPPSTVAFPSIFGDVQEFAAEYMNSNEEKHEDLTANQQTDEKPNEKPKEQKRNIASILLPSKGAHARSEIKSLHLQSTGGRPTVHRRVKLCRGNKTNKHLLLKFGQ